MAKASRFFKIDDDILMEVIYHDQSNPSAYAIETDNNGSEMYFIGTDGVTGGQKLLVHELGSSVVNFEVTEDQANKFLVVENITNRSLVLAPGNTYQFDVSALTNPTSFDINDTTLGTKSYSAGIFSYTPTKTGEYKYTYTDTISALPVVYNQGKVSVMLKANPLYAIPNEDTGNNINTGPGQPNRYHGVAVNEERTKFALLDSTWNYIQNSGDWVGDSYATILASLPYNSLNTNSVVYETIRLHLRSGYNFAGRGYEGFLFEVRVPRISGIMNNFTQIVYLNSSNYELQNPEPFILSETLYSKFIEIKVPSLKDLDPDFAELFFGLAASGNEVDPTAQYDISFKLIDTYKTQGGFDFIETAEETNFALAIEDEFIDISASVTESTEGDYFEMVGLYNGSAASFNSYITNRINTSSDDITVSHDITIFEQIGNSFIKTFQTTFNQTQDFDEPITFRPIIKNAAGAVSFTIDYTLRVYNETDNTQIVKNSSWNSLNSINKWTPTKFGKKLQNIVLKNSNVETKVYNKLPMMNMATATEKAMNLNPIQSQVKYVQNFTERVNIVTSNSSVNINAGTALETSATAFVGEGLAEISISPVDTFIKFKVAKEIDGDLEAVNLTNAETLYLLFDDGAGKQVKFANTQEYKAIDSSMGEILFKVDKGNANIVRGFVNKQFLITIYNGSNETMLYSGKFKNA
jgi:hypothetical protein